MSVYAYSGAITQNKNITNISEEFSIRILVHIYQEIGSCSFNDCMSWRKNRFITTRKIDIWLLHRRGKKMYQALVGKHKRMSTSTFKIGKFSLKEEIFHKTHAHDRTNYAKRRYPHPYVDENKSKLYSYLLFMEWSEKKSIKKNGKVVNFYQLIKILNDNRYFTYVATIEANIRGHLSFLLWLIISWNVWTFLSLLSLIYFLKKMRQFF